MATPAPPPPIVMSQIIHALRAPNAAATPQRAPLAKSRPVLTVKRTNVELPGTMKVRTPLKIDTP